MKKSKHIIAAVLVLVTLVVGTPIVSTQVNAACSHTYSSQCYSYDTNLHYRYCTKCNNRQYASHIWVTVVNPGGTYLWCTHCNHTRR